MCAKNQKRSSQRYRKYTLPDFHLESFMVTLKCVNLKKIGNVINLPLRPLLSNIDTATYYLSKYLAKMLSRLSQSEYTMKNTKDFIEQFKNISALENSNLTFHHCSQMYLLTIK